MTVVDTGCIDEPAFPRRRDARGGIRGGRHDAGGHARAAGPRGGGDAGGSRRGASWCGTRWPAVPWTACWPWAARPARRSARRPCAALPIGVPKLMVSTLASGQVRAVRRRQRHSDAEFGRRHRRPQSDQPPRSWPTPPRRWPAWCSTGCAEVGRGPAAGRGHHVRRDHAVRAAGPRGAGSRRATKCWCFTPRATAGRPWSR